MNEKFDELEHPQLGQDGLDDAVRQMAEIEVCLGLRRPILEPTGF
jgi:hypothetical protein